MSEFLCIFEDKRFSNFFPLSLSQPVFELKIGGKSFRLRLQDEMGAEKVGVLCRDYLAPAFAQKEPGIMVNDIPGGDTIFLNGRLLCYSDELKQLLDKIPGNSIAVKGGYVLAARLPDAAAGDFSSYITVLAAPVPKNSDFGTMTTRPSDRDIITTLTE